MDAVYRRELQAQLPKGALFLLSQLFVSMRLIAREEVQQVHKAGELGKLLERPTLESALSHTRIAQLLKMFLCV